MSLFSRGRAWKSLLPILLLCLVACNAFRKETPDSAQAKANESKLQDEPMNVLLRASELDDSAVGYAGIRTPAYDAFSKLYKAGKGTEESRRLMKAASPAGKVYGYLVLRHLAPAEAEAAVKPLENDQTEVLVMNGCIGNHSTIRALVARIRNGERVIHLPR
jgi:hypothetical protein